MKIKVDFDRCESHAMCESLAPDNFQVDDDDYLQILDENVTDANRDNVERAVASCPMTAISLVED